MAVSSTNAKRRVRTARRRVASAQPNAMALLLPTGRAPERTASDGSYESPGVRCSTHLRFRAVRLTPARSRDRPALETQFERLSNTGALRRNKHFHAVYPYQHGALPEERNQKRRARAAQAQKPRVLLRSKKSCADPCAARAAPIFTPRRPFTAQGQRRARRRPPRRRRGNPPRTARQDQNTYSRAGHDDVPVSRSRGRYCE